MKLASPVQEDPVSCRSLDAPQIGSQPSVVEGYALRPHEGNEAAKVLDANAPLLGATQVLEP